MELLALFTSLSLTAAGGGATFVQVLTVLGGLSGVAAFVGVFVQLWTNSRKAKQDDKAVGITVLEKAVPGMGTIVEYFEKFTAHLQSENARLQSRVTELESEKEAWLKSNQ